MSRPESPRVTQSHPESPRVTPLPPAILLAEARATADLDDIPGFLYRGPSDGAVAAEIKAQIDDKKREKARVRIEHMKAKRSGETRKMPLTGRAALDALK